MSDVFIKIADNVKWYYRQLFRRRRSPSAGEWASFLAWPNDPKHSKE